MMRRHFLCLCGCIFAGAAAAGLLAEALFPSGYAVVSASMWCASWAAVIAGVTYILAALLLQDYETIVRKERARGHAILSKASVISFGSTMTAAVLFLTAVRLRWIDW